MEEDYETKMIKKYQNDVQKQELKIISNDQLLDLSFVDKLSVNSLTVFSCYNIIFKELPLKVTILQLNKCKLESITGLEQMIWLKSLNLFENLLSSIDPVKFLVNLNELNLGNNFIADLSPLQPLKHLTILEAFSNNISSLAPLQKLNLLTNINMYSNSISDISPLRNLKNLKFLYLGFNQISDVHILQFLPLTELDLNENQIVNIEPFKFLKLHFLTVSRNYITDLSHLDVFADQTLQMHQQQVPSQRQILIANRTKTIYQNEDRKIKMKSFSLKNESTKRIIKTFIDQMKEKEIHTYKMFINAIHEETPWQ
ncbi:internalin [Hexamita inflata]|uniref:Internalin n=1 Tax=Hexamita inflata TaxID=28002 RepID=A0AA86UK86_9EUKA|nr:internalin [Hexamita inflata]